MRYFLSLALCALFLLAAPQLAEAACDEPTELEALMSESKAAETAFANMDETALLRHSTNARAEILPCLGESVTTEAAAAFHRLMALEAFIKANNVRTIAELHAARRLEPGYSFPVEVAGPGHPLLDFYKQAATVSDGAPQVVYAPKGGSVTVDGVRDAPRPSETPVIIQVFAPSGAILETRYLQPGETLPRWGDNAFGLTAEDIGGVRKVNLTNPRPWFIAGTVSLVASGVFYAAAMDQKAKFNDPMNPDANLDAYQQRNGTFGVLSLSAAGAGLALTGTGVGFQIRFGGKGQAPHVSAGATKETP